jgi:ATP adenylyltransferase
MAFLYLLHMEHLWAPWRNTYVKDGAKHEGDTFTRIAQGTDDEAHYVLTRGKACFALLNLYPYNTGHLLVLPYRQTGALEDLSDDETLEMWTMVKRLKAALTAAFRPDGFNIGINLGAAAGAGIEQHLHVHLVPRWRNDANFMTITAETRVHPNDLAGIYAAIKKQL